MRRLVAPTLALFLVSSIAWATEVPGTPQPSTGAPGDKPTRNSPFGTQGAKAEQTGALKAHKPILESVQIEGNRHTSEREILRHLAARPGDEIGINEVSTSRIRLLQIGAFSDVQAELRPGSQPGLVVLHLQVKERNTVFITDLLYGSTATTNFYGGLGVADADLFSLGVSGSLSALYSTNADYAVHATLYEPDFQMMGISWVGGLDFLDNYGRENACGDVSCYADRLFMLYHRVGGEVSLGLRDPSYSRFLVGYRFERISSAPAGSPGAAPYILPGLSHLSAIAFEYDRDSRDETFLPTRGARIQGKLLFSSLAIGSSYEYSQFFVQIGKWIPLPAGRAFRLDFVAGAVQGNAPFFDRFYVADWSYFNVGLAISRMLELNLSPDPRYDMILLVGGGEYDVPLWKLERFFIHRSYLAVGARVVWSAAAPGLGRDKVSAWPVSGDFAIRLDTPAGVFNLSVAYFADQVGKELVRRHGGSP